jgi:hypothetical protein
MSSAVTVCKTPEAGLPPPHNCLQEAGMSPVTSNFRRRLALVLSKCAGLPAPIVILSSAVLGA